MSWQWWHKQAGKQKRINILQPSEVQDFRLLEPKIHEQRLEHRNNSNKLQQNGSRYADLNAIRLSDRKRAENGKHILVDQNNTSRS